VLCLLDREVRGKSRLKEPVFSPPRINVDDDLAWLLRAAFADALTGPPPSDPVRALQLARDTELSGRIAKRLGGWHGASELDTLARGLEEDYYANVAKEALLTQARERIIALAATLGVPIIFAKFAGLRLAGVVRPGTRMASDLDVLLPEAEANKFWHALLDAGFQRTRTHGYAHQLEALVDEHGAFVDLHVHLPGVIVEKGGFATADQLIARGLVSRLSGSILVPCHAILVAHAIAHALLQNRATPQTYSPLRMVADLVDLRRVEPDVVSLARNYLTPELGGVCVALNRLCVALTEGVFAGVGFDGTREQTLLWHCLAARVDHDYSERLRAGGLADKLRDGSSPLEIARYVADLVYPSEPALDLLYGPAMGRIARIRRRLLRPVDLIVRATRRWARSR
jgi:hypothetical protein